MILLSSSHIGGYHQLGQVRVSSGLYVGLVAACSYFTKISDIPIGKVRIDGGLDPEALPVLALRLLLDLRFISQLVWRLSPHS